MEALQRSELERESLDITLERKESHIGEVIIAITSLTHKIWGNIMNVNHSIFKLIRHRRSFIPLMICAISTSFILSTQGYAQGTRLAQRLDKKMTESQFGLFGVRLHANFASLSVNRSSDPFMKDPGSGANIGLGVVFDKAFNRLMGVRAEALFQKKSFSASAVPNYDLTKTERIDTQTTLNFIEIPIMAVARFRFGEFIRPYAAGGVYGSMLLYSDGEQDGEGMLDEPRRPFSTFDYGLVFAGGAYFVLAEGFGYLSAELRYSRGFANLADQDVSSTKEEKDEDLKFPKTPLARQQYFMHNVSLMIGYYF